ncbi:MULTISPECIES: DsbA family protein [Streptomyces]|uniref:DsbA family protein n=1 Tax=Streptomyces TaxID=1883 RepID=UPI001E629E7A|nr:MULTISPECIES: thioredoxin domain-containing protein [Streptomyces]UFQ16524.1 DsbA family protein [Streptomyces huasconensis]WCL86126.1 thioredoxin domain-containing protein [Streptomyces sp. JCM 35825]
MAVHKAGRKAGRVVTAVAAAALIGAAAAACGPDGGDGDGDNGRVDKAGKSSSAAPESKAPKSKAPESEVPGAGGSDAPEAKAPPAAAGRLAQVPASVKGGVITVGDPKAAHTVKVYEDSRCPFCKKFEEGGARALVGPVADGEVRIEYTIASFLDNNLGGSGSVNAANALRASVEAGRFPQFHAAVFANQPEEESDDAYTPAFLLKIADKVDGLRGAAFDKAVTNGTYKKWVGEAMKAFTDDGIQGTPTVFIDGKKAAGNSLYEQGAFAKELKAAGIS